MGIYTAWKRKKREEEEEEEEEEEGEGGEEGGMAAGGGGAVSNARRGRRRGESENPLGAKTDGAGATAPPQPASPDGWHGAQLCPAICKTMTTAASAGGPVRHV